MATSKAAVEKNNKIRAYFKETFAGTVRSVNEARDKMQRKFKMGTKKWHAMRPQFVRIMQQVQRIDVGKGDSSPTIEEMSSPVDLTNLPQVDQLLVVNQQQDTKIMQLNHQIQLLTATIQWQELKLKKYSKMITDLLNEA